MIRKNFIIVDDVPRLANRIHSAVTDYYNRKRDYSYELKSFYADSHFEDAKYYIGKHFHDIDVIFSDQKLKNGTGLELFNLSNKNIDTAFSSITLKTHIFKVLHSNEYKRMHEHQAEHFKLYNYFINSANKADIFSFLDYYDENILKVKRSGNNVYNDFLDRNSALRHKFNSTIIDLDGKKISLRDVFVMVMDKDNSNSDYYHFFYNDGDRVRMTLNSRKFSLSGLLKDMEFISANLEGSYNEKIKINPLWISGINYTNSTINLFQPYNMAMEIKAVKVISKQNLNDEGLDKYFR